VCVSALRPSATIGAMTRVDSRAERRCRRARPGWRGFVGWALAALAIVGVDEAAAQGGYLARLNASYDDIFAGEGDDPGERTDMALLPLVAEMDPAPAGLESGRDAALAHPELSREVWSSAEAWVGGEAQQAVIAKLGEITELDRVLEMGWGQPYGIDGLEQIELVEAGLYTEVPESLLGGARLLYLDGLDAVHKLVNIEATRRQLAGEPLEALGLLRDWMLVVNQITEREFAAEKFWAMRRMAESLERMRDVAYADFKGERGLRAREKLGALSELLGTLKKVSDGGYVRIDRLGFPEGDAMAARQFAEVLLDADGADEDRFAETLASLRSRGNPLRMFSELPRVRRLEPMQLSERVAISRLEGMVNDLRLRWNAEPFDPIWGSRSEVEEQMESAGSRLLAGWQLLSVLELFELRRQVEVERVGTRHALALLAHSYEQVIPPTPTVAAPRWIDRIENDPYNPRSARPEASAFLEYIYLGRSPSSGRTHSVAIVPEAAPRFERRFDGRDFLLYSVGTDGSDDGAVEVQNTPEEVVDADYLIWPPVLSLLRQHLLDRQGG